MSTVAAIAVMTVTGTACAADGTNESPTGQSLGVDGDQVGRA
jgi:hypothetical protein